MHCAHRKQRAWDPGHLSCRRHGGHKAALGYILELNELMCTGLRFTRGMHDALGKRTAFIEMQYRLYPGEEKKYISNLDHIASLK